MYGPQILLKFERLDKEQDVMEVELCPPKDEAKCAKSSMGWVNNNRTRLFLSAPRPCSLSFEEEWIRGNNKNEGIHWMIYVDGTHVGGVGLHQISEEHGHAELGLMIGDQDYWGKGIAQVITVAVMEYAFENLIPGGLHKIAVQALVSDDGLGNNHSRGTLQKVGFGEVGIAREHLWHQGRWYDLWMGEIIQRDWIEMREEKFRITGIIYLNIYPGCEDIGFEPVVSGG